VQLFGYGESEDANSEDTSSSADDGPTTGGVFAVNATRRVADAGGTRRRRDVVIRIRAIDELDCYITVTRRGIISAWNSKVRVTTSSAVGLQT